MDWHGSWNPFALSGLLQLLNEGVLHGRLQPKEWPWLDRIHPGVASQRSDDLMFHFFSCRNILGSSLICQQPRCSQEIQGKQVSAGLGPLCAGTSESLRVINCLKPQSLLPFHCGLGREDRVGC